MKSKRLLRMAIKEVSSDGSFEGSLAVYNNIDLGGDLIEPGAFTNTIREHGNEVPLLWQHKSDKPIGLLTLIDGPGAIRVKGQLLMDLPEARNAYLLIKARIVRGLSIGFDTVKDAVDGAVRRLKELRLWEGSIVTFPMNELALITSVKARRAAKADFTTEYAELQLQDAAYQMWLALRSALCSIPWSDLSKEEKLAASEASIGQFNSAYMEFLPAYLDWLDEEYGEFSTMGREPGERKTGKRISAASAKRITSAREHVKSADDILAALIDLELEDEDDDNTGDDEGNDKGNDDPSQEKTAVPTEPEPTGVDHSAANHLIDSIRSLIPAA